MALDGIKAAGTPIVINLGWVGTSRSQGFERAGSFAVLTYAKRMGRVYERMVERGRRRRERNGEVFGFYFPTLATSKRTQNAPLPERRGRQEAGKNSGSTRTVSGVDSYRKGIIQRDDCDGRSLSRREERDKKNNKRKSLYGNSHDARTRKGGWEDNRRQNAYSFIDTAYLLNGQNVYSSCE